MCGLLAEENRGYVLSQRVDALTLTHPLSLSLKHTHWKGKTWQSDTITTQQIAVQPAVGLCASCLSIQTTALNCLLCSFSGVLCLHMQATISVQQQLTRETVGIIVCRSLLAALTSGESLCGALTELFEVSVSVVGSGMARACATC